MNDKVWRAIAMPASAQRRFSPPRTEKISFLFLNYCNKGGTSNNFHFLEAPGFAIHSLFERSSICGFYESI
jgi:hypothetical protein